MYVLDGFDEDAGVLVAHLPEEIQLEDGVLDSLATLGSAYHQYICV